MAVNEQVLGLQVAVEDAAHVAKLDALAELFHPLLNHVGAEAEGAQSVAGVFREGLAAAALLLGQAFHELLEIHVEKFKDQIELMAVGVYNIEQTDYVLVLHLLQQRNLADGGRRDTLIIGFEANFLQSDYFPLVGKIPSLVDNTISSCNGGGVGSENS